MRIVPLIMIGGLLSACSHGLQEVSFAVHDDQDGAHYIVTRDVVSSRVTAGQPHTAGQFHCTGKYTSEEMASLRASYGEHTWYKDCTPTEYLPMHKYVLTSDQPIASLYSAPVSAAVLSMGFGAGLAFSGSKITQNGGNSSSGAIGVGSSSSNSSSFSYSQGGAGGNVTVPGHHKW